MVIPERIVKRQTIFSQNLGRKTDVLLTGRWLFRGEIKSHWRPRIQCLKVAIFLLRSPSENMEMITMRGM